MRRTNFRAMSIPDWDCIGRFQAIFSSTDLGADDEVAQSDYEHVGNARLKTLQSQARQALLLTAMEGFAPEDAAHLLDVSIEEVKTLVDDALSEIERQTRTSVLIIEDEPMIAMDLEAIVRELGHNVTGVAVTRDEAVASAAEHQPGLVLADIQLADDSSGIDAVADILKKHHCTGDLHHGIPRASADRRAARANVPDHQALSARHRARRDQPGLVFRQTNRTCVRQLQANNRDGRHF